MTFPQSLNLHHAAVEPEKMGNPQRLLPEEYAFVGSGRTGFNRCSSHVASGLSGNLHECFQNVPASFPVGVGCYWACN